VTIQIILSIVYLFGCKSIVKGNKFARLIMLFFVAWYSLQLTLAIADPYNVYTIRPITILAYNFQIVFLLLGCYFFYCKNKTKKIGFDNNKIFTISNNKYLLIVQTLFFLNSVLKFRKMRDYLSTVGDLTNSSRDFYFNGFFSSYTELMVNQIITSYLLISYFVLYGVLFFMNRKRSWKDHYLAITSIFAVVITSLTTMGRMEMMEFAMVFFFFLMYSTTIQDKRKKHKIKMFGAVIISLLVFVIGAVTLIRSNLLLGESSSIGALKDSFAYLILEPFVTYYYVPILAFDYATQHQFATMGLFFGGADLAGFIDFITLPIQLLFNDFPTINGAMGVMTPFFAFPSGREWNALFTGAANYYLDFRYVGFIIFPFILGYLINYLCRSARKGASQFILLLFFFLSVYKSIFSSAFQSTSIVFFLLWIYFFRKTKTLS